MYFFLNPICHNSCFLIKMDILIWAKTNCVSSIMRSGGIILNKLLLTIEFSRVY